MSDGKYKKGVKMKVAILNMMENKKIKGYVFLVECLLLSPAMFASGLCHLIDYGCKKLNKKESNV